MYKQALYEEVGNYICFIFAVVMYLFCSRFVAGLGGI